MVHNLMERLLETPAWVVYLVAGGLVFAEDALFVGFVLPGETAAFLGGVSAHRGHVELGWMIVIVVTAAIVGDTVGYEIGRHAGPRIFETKLLQRHQHRLVDAERFLARRGGSAVFLGRFTAFFRAVMPALAGAARMPYRTFVMYNALGGIVWGTGVVLLGYLAGRSYQRVEAWLGRTTAALAGVIIIGLLIWWVIRKRRAERDPADAEPVDLLAELPDQSRRPGDQS